MKGICINGEIYISRRTLEREIARLKRTVGIDDKYAPFSEKERNIAKLAWGDIVRFIHKEELADALADADTPEKIREAYRSVLELPWDWLVAKFDEHPSDDPDIDLEIESTYFCEFKDGKPVFSDCADDAMWFDYKSKAEEVAGTCGEGFEVLDMSPEARILANRMKEKLLKAIFKKD